MIVSVPSHADVHATRDNNWREERLIKHPSLSVATQERLQRQDACAGCLIRGDTSRGQISSSSCELAHLDPAPLVPQPLQLPLQDFHLL